MFPNEGAGKSGDPREMVPRYRPAIPGERPDSDYDHP